MLPVSEERAPSYHHEPADEPLLGTTIDACFRAVARRHAGRDAVVSIPQDLRLTYAELDARVEAFARGMVAMGIERGDRVGIWSTDNAEWIVVQMATARIGAILVNINPAWRAKELAQALTLARIQMLLLIPSFRRSRYVDMVAEVVPEVIDARPGDLPGATFPALRHVVVFDPEGRSERSPGSAFRTWSDVVDAGAAVGDEVMRRRCEPVDADDPINIQFTSGTTGIPKPVMLTGHGILNNAWYIGRRLGFDETDRLCVPVPFYHCFGMVVSTLVCLLRGAAVVIPSPHFDPEATLRAVEQERCTALHGVPTMFIAMLESREMGRRDLGSLRTGIMAGAPCPHSVLARVIEDMGCREILVGYGQTESSPVTHLTRRDDSLERRLDTVGTSLPHQEAKIVDPDTGGVVPIGTPGEVCFRGYHLMRGYFQRPEDTAEAIDAAGWLHSGDLGVMDGQGYVRITGRLRDMVIRAGENIYPAELEETFRGHPKIADVAVFGMPDEFLGEQVGAWITLHEDVSADPEELRTWARERLAHYKVPAHIWIVDEFPLTATGKVQKFRIQETVATWLRDDASGQRSGRPPMKCSS